MKILKIFWWYYHDFKGWLMMEGKEHENSVRKFTPFEEAMIRYHGEIERIIYAAEILCHSRGTKYVQDCVKDCKFAQGGCTLVQLRSWIGDQKHD